MASPLLRGLLVVLGLVVVAQHALDEHGQSEHDEHSSRDGLGVLAPVSVCDDLDGGGCVLDLAVEHMSSFLSL